MTTALITGIGGTRSIAVMKALREADKDVRIIGTDANYFNAGSFQCDVSYIVPLASDTDYLSRLQRIIKDEKVDIVFATVEKEVVFLAAHKDELEATVLVPDSAILDICFDKYRTQEFLKTNGFHDIPSVLHDDQAVAHTFAEQQGYPLIRKPLHGYGSRDVSILHDAEELEASPPDPDFVLQRFIDNEDTETFYNTTLNEYTAEVFINADGSEGGGIIIKRALHAGETVAGYRVHDEDTLSYLTEVAKKLAIKGPCNFQYRRQAGTPYIFEINPLFSGTTAIRAHLGFNGVGLALDSFVRGQHRHLADTGSDEYFIRYLHEAYVDASVLKDFAEEKKTSNG